ncbi:3-deoxy-D-manno-octulosonic acid transferase [Vibrio cholerae]|nr:3-deoxy-D-manno-octulosonic acid transferase [Vibrio cholerae]
MLSRFLYTLVLFIAAPLLLYGLYKRKKNKPPFGSRWKEHFGYTPKLKDSTRPIWIHAVSVGESLAAIPLIKALKERSPDMPIVVTTTTSTGAEQIAKLGELVEHRYMPIDFTFAVKRFLTTINPSQLLIIETELWPNTLQTVHRFGIQTTVINARLSEKSQQRYAKVQPLFNTIAPCLSKVLCQSQSDAERFTQLGIEKEKITVTGSIKFDIHISDEVKYAGHSLREKLGKERPIWIAASTHKGEDEQVLSAHRVLLEHYPDALLILVPRHPERFENVFDLCLQQKFKVLRRSSQQEMTHSAQVYLADTMGEMLILMSTADICFMGGSLAGEHVGGHNILEPAALGVPIITGPSYYNFAEIVHELVAVHGIHIVPDASALTTVVYSWFQEPEQREKYSQNASTVVHHNRGALQRTLNWIG